jgi:hypothetical protein
MVAALLTGRGDLAGARVRIARCRGHFYVDLRGGGASGSLKSCFDSLCGGTCAVLNFSGAKPLSGKAICPICEKRRAERYCPAKGEKICAIDCGTGREVTIDCPIDCAYLVAAHRWEQSHPKPLAAGEVPFPDVSFSSDLIHTRQTTLSGLGYTVLTYAADQRSLADPDVFTAVQALAETRRTLLSGIYYEKPPEIPVSAGLYTALAKFIEEEKKHSTEHPEFPALKDTEIFHLLVFFLRFGRLRSNGRPRTRAFLEFLRSQFPAEVGAAKQEPRIILP